MAESESNQSIDEMNKPLLVHFGWLDRDWHDDAEQTLEAPIHYKCVWHSMDYITCLAKHCGYCMGVDAVEAFIIVRVLS